MYEELKITVVTLGEEDIVRTSNGEGIVEGDDNVGRWD